jgi:anti-sigma factor RsiW
MNREAMSRHLAETGLALYASGDLPFWRGTLVKLHLRRCDECRGLVEALRRDREELRGSADDMPGNVDWDQLAAEMTANIRVGLAAGECVTPRERKIASISWRPAAIAAGLVVLMAGAWWLNIPRTDTEAIGRAIRDMASGGRATATQENRDPVVGASSTGVELVENGGQMRIKQGGLEPVMFSVSTQGSASARYVEDTGQVTITATYVQ